MYAIVDRNGAIIYGPSHTRPAIPGGLRLSWREVVPVTNHLMPPAVFRSTGGEAQVFLRSNNGGEVVISVIADYDAIFDRLQRQAMNHYGGKVYWLPTPSTFRDFCGLLWGYALERLEARIWGEKAIHRRIKKYQQKIELAIARHKDGTELLTYEAIMKLHDELKRLVDQVVDPRIPYKIRPKPPELRELYMLAIEIKQPDLAKIQELRAQLEALDPYASVTGRG